MIFYGEKDCEGLYMNGEHCKNKSYWKVGKRYFCGVHSKKFQYRKKLNKNPDGKKEKKELLKKRIEIVESLAQSNRLNNIKGNVIVSKLKMMKIPEYHEGYLNVFPNYKHQNRIDGFGCSSLSPKSIGPINHIMPNLPVSKNLENYHQFAKIFSWEIKNFNKKDFNSGEIKEEIIEKRKEAYNSDIPYRHKYSRDFLVKKLKNSDNINIPLFSVYYDKEGNERRFNYLQCRYFYCHWYEKIVKTLEDFKFLKSKLENGYNLNIVGYDGYSIEKDLYEHYLDISKPFGHEMVLATMLIVENSNEYPWNKFKTENKEIYKDLF